jgi:hypothetical protein
MAKDYTPQFKDAEQVWKITEEMQKVESLRALDRARIDGLMNGRKPFTEAEREKYQVHYNVNWNEGGKILQDANRQLNNALIYKDRFFTATSLGGKVEKRDQYGMRFTKNIHKHLKRGPSGKRLMHVLKSRNASLGLHGIGPLMWNKSFCWMMRYVALEDLLIPTDTLVDLSNMVHFAVNMDLTQGEFFDLTHGDKVDSGWKIQSVRQVLDDLSKATQNNQSQNHNFMDQPEKWVEWFKQNRCFLDSDVVPTVKLRLFFYQNPKTKAWHRCIILRVGTTNVQAKDSFIYDGRDKPFAESLDRFLHIQFGDNSLCPPLKYHSVRGLGVMLYAQIEANNRFRNEFFEHVSLNLKTFLRIQNPVDRDRPKMLDLSQYSVVPEGTSFIPNTDRHQIDSNLVEFAQSQVRQLMNEGSASYVQDINDGTSKERTATETNAMVQSVNLQVNAMLQSAYIQEMYLWEEVVRRFLSKNSEDEEVIEFQKQCKKDRIPDFLMVPENWQIDPERVLGGGDQFLAKQEADSLLSQSQRFDPKSQRQILRKWVATTTRNPDMADNLVPNDPAQADAGTFAAEDVFGTLLAGIPISIREGIERTSYIQSLLGMFGSKVQQIMQTGGVGTAENIIGLQTVGQHIEQNIAILEQDATQGEFVKVASDELGKLLNETKGFQQRLQQQMEAAATEQDPEAMAKVQTQTLLAENKMQISQATTQQKMQQKQMAFEQKMRQDMEKHTLDMQRMMADMDVDIITKGARTKADIEATKAKAEAAPDKNGAEN